jgi:hypothetical protein
MLIHSTVGSQSLGHLAVRAKSRDPCLTGLKLYTLHSFCTPASILRICISTKPSSPCLAHASTSDLLTQVNYAALSKNQQGDRGGVIMLGCTQAHACEECLELMGRGKGSAPFPAFGCGGDSMATAACSAGSGGGEAGSSTVR